MMEEAVENGDGGLMKHRIEVCLCYGGFISSSYQLLVLVSLFGELLAMPCTLLHLCHVY